MAKMLAALHDGKGRMELAEIDKPVAGPGEVVVKVRAVGICGSDLLIYADNDRPETQPGGHEVAGEVVEVGEGVDPALLGKRVAVEVIGAGRACGRCWYCRMGQYRQCLDKANMGGGGFAQFVRRRAMGCFPLPDALTWEEGALVEPLAVSIHALRRGGLKGGETVAVLGAGNIGLTTVAAARAMGAGHILVTARHEHQAALARRLGADDVLPPEGSALDEALAHLTDGRGADMTVETVGGRSGSTLEQAIRVTRMQGRIVVLGGFRRPVTLDWLEPLLKEQTVVFSSCYSVMDGYHDYELAIDLMDQGQAPIRQMVTHKFPLEDIQRGFETAYNKGTGSIKVQIHME